MFDRTPEERLLEVRQGLVADIERHQKALDTANAKLVKAEKRLQLFDDGCKGLGARAEMFDTIASLEKQFSTDDDDSETGEVS
jgi:hypothetical protein